MHRLLILVLALLPSLPLPAHAYQETVAFEEEPLLSVIIEPEDVFTGGAFVQGEIVVTVRVSSLLPFEALNVEMPVIEGARVETLIKPRMREVRSYAGKGYVLERVIAIYPQKSGKLVLPPIRATGRVEPEKDKPLDFVEESPEITLDVAGIAPGFRGDWWLVSRALTISETWSVPIEDLREGDVVRREITITAAGVPYERLPQIQASRTSGIEATDAGTTGNTLKTRDGVVGTLTRAWDLKIGVGDTLYVSPIGIDYWDPGEQVQKKAGLSGHRIEPLPPDEDAIARALMAEAASRRNDARWIAVAVGALVAMPLLGVFLSWLWALIPTRADRRLVAACGADPSPAAVYRAATHWAADSDLDPRRIGQDGGGELVQKLFAGGSDDVDARAVGAALCRASRRDRVGRTRRNWGRLASRILGQPRRLVRN